MEQLSTGKDDFSSIGHGLSGESYGLLLYYWRHVGSHPTI